MHNYCENKWINEHILQSYFSIWCDWWSLPNILWDSVTDLWDVLKHILLLFCFTYSLASWFIHLHPIPLDSKSPISKWEQTQYSSQLGKHWLIFIHFPHLCIPYGLLDISTSTYGGKKVDKGMSCSTGLWLTVLKQALSLNQTLTPKKLGGQQSPRITVYVCHPDKLPIHESRKTKGLFSTKKAIASTYKIC